MKILFVGNYDMAGSYLASRMYREGNEISWLTQSQEEELWGDKIRGKVYRRTITDKTCSRILLGEAIDCVIFLTAEYREGYLGSDEEYGSLLSVLSPVLHAAASVKVGKICFLSSENVENKGLLPPIFEELRAGERIITSFCREKGISSLILRLGCVFGEGTLKETGYLGKILQSMKTEKKVFCPFTETSSFDVLCASDLADGAFRLLTMNASGMYEVITGYPVSAKTLYSMAAEAAGFQGKIEFGQKEHVCDPEGGQRIRMACGWMPFYLFEEKGMDFLKKNLQQEALAENAEKKKNKRKSYSFFYETGQNLLLFVIMCLASSFSVDWSDLRFVDVRLLYVILVAISFGMRQGLLATGLAIISYTLSLLYSGIDISYVFYSVESWIPFIVYGVAGAFAGYWSDKKNDEYEGLMNEYAEQTEKYQFLKELYREIVEVKNHLQKQIMITKDSFSRIYEITETLDSLSPRVVCSRTVKVMEEIMECDSVAIYVKPQEGSSYGRLLVCSAKLSRKLSPSIDFQNELIKNYDDPEFNLDGMETVISCRGREDNTRLLEMIQAVNDTSRDINEVLDTYFDRDNYLQWLAFNLLMGNRDTTMQNFYLYSPLNGQKWYFIPWDGDASLMRYEQEMESGQPIADWEWGIGNYWGVILHQRFLKNERNRQELEAVIDEMHQWLNKETIDEMAAEYYETVKPYIYAMPDVLNLQHTQGEVEDIISRLGDDAERNYQETKESFTDPMPFWMYAPEGEDEQIKLSWEAAYDFRGQNMEYHLEVSAKPDMSSPIINETGLSQLSYTVPKETLGTGEFYWRVTAVRDDGTVAEAMNEVIIDGTYYLGIDRFTIN